MNNNLIKGLKKQLIQAELDHKNESKKHRESERRLRHAEDRLERISEEYWNQRFSERTSEILSKIKKAIKW